MQATTITIPTTATTGKFRAWRTRWFGQPDPVDEQLREIARQGARMSHVAHAFAIVLIVLFSAASLVALGADALKAIQVAMAHGGMDVPSAISLAVVTLIVPASDVAMLYAANMLRILSARRAPWQERIVHIVVMLGVAALESCMYTYMAWKYEHPAMWLAWSLIVARAASASLLSIYLSMARPLPVTSRDILYQAELASGAGLIRDVVREANDRDASLAEKMELYSASAIMTPPDRERLDTMISVMRHRVEAVPTIVDADSTPPSPAPPTGPGTGRKPPIRIPAQNGHSTHDSALTLVPVDGWRPTRNAGNEAAADTSKSPIRIPKKPRTKAAVRTPVRTLEKSHDIESRARAAYRPGMSVGQLKQNARIRSRATADRWLSILEAEHAQQYDRSEASAR